MPFVRPVTVRLVADGAAFMEMLPGCDVTVYPVMALPPSSAGVVQDTTAWAFPDVAVTPEAAVETPALGLTALLDVLAGLIPTALVAVTVNVYGMPLVSPVTMAEVAPVVAVAPPGLVVTV